MRQLSEEISKFVTEHEESGKTVVYVGVQGVVEGAFAVSDELKSDARETVTALRERGIESIMVTGDNLKTARAIARACGIEIIHAEASPTDKVEHHQRITIQTFASSEGRVQTDYSGDGRRRRQ